MKRPRLVVNPGGPMRRPGPAAHARPGPVVNPGGPMVPAPKPHHKAAPRPVVNPGGPMVPAPKRRGLALADSVACCAAEALAASLRLTGWPVTDDDVLALYWRTASDPDAGASILATLEAAAAHGLAAMRPVSFAPAAVLGDPWQLLDEGLPSLILGLDLPGPHAVTDDGHAWWSWGEPHDVAGFPDAVVEEAWEVRWAA